MNKIKEVKITASTYVDILKEKLKCNYKASIGSLQNCFYRGNDDSSGFTITYNGSTLILGLYVNGANQITHNVASSTSMFYADGQNDFICFGFSNGSIKSIRMAITKAINLENGIEQYGYIVSFGNGISMVSSNIYDTIAIKQLVQSNDIISLAGIVSVLGKNRFVDCFTNRVGPNYNHTQEIVMDNIHYILCENNYSDHEKLVFKLGV